MYRVQYTEEAIADLKRLRQNEPIAFKKITKLLSEIETNPYVGTGKPEQLKGDKKGTWSRRINKKHRLIYKVIEDKIIVLIISAYGHYDDK